MGSASGKGRCPRADWLRLAHAQYNFARVQLVGRTRFEHGRDGDAELRDGGRLHSRHAQREPAGEEATGRAAVRGRTGRRCQQHGHRGGAAGEDADLPAPLGRAAPGADRGAAGWGRASRRSGFKSRPAGLRSPPECVRALLQADKEETRRIPVPANRYTPLKENWMKIFTPIVEHLGLQIRFNLKSRNVEIRVRRRVALSLPTEFSPSEMKINECISLNRAFSSKWLVLLVALLSEENFIFSILFLLSSRQLSRSSSSTFSLEVCTFLLCLASCLVYCRILSW